MWRITQFFKKFIHGDTEVRELYEADPHLLDRAAESFNKHRDEIHQRNLQADKKAIMAVNEYLIRKSIDRFGVLFPLPN